MIIPVICAPVLGTIDTISEIMIFHPDFNFQLQNRRAEAMCSQNDVWRGRGAQNSTPSRTNSCTPRARPAPSRTLNDAQRTCATRRSRSGGLRSPVALHWKLKTPRTSEGSGRQTDVPRRCGRLSAATLSTFLIFTAFPILLAMGPIPYFFVSGQYESLEADMH